MLNISSKETKCLVKLALSSPRRRPAFSSASASPFATTTTEDEAKVAAALATFSGPTPTSLAQQESRKSSASCPSWSHFRNPGHFLPSLFLPLIPRRTLTSDSQEKKNHCFKLPLLSFLRQLNEFKVGKEAFNIGALPLPAFLGKAREATAQFKYR